MNNQNINIEHCDQTQITQNQESIFLYTTITGSLQLIHLEEIGYFRYNSKSKLWEVMLSNKHTLILKRNTNSQKILSLHPYLLQISQSYIINISYLASIEDNNCVLLRAPTSKQVLHEKVEGKIPLSIKKSIIKTVYLSTEPIKTLCYGTNKNWT